MNKYVNKALAKQFNEPAKSAPAPTQKPSQAVQAPVQAVQSSAPVQAVKAAAPAQAASASANTKSQSQSSGSTEKCNINPRSYRVAPQEPEVKNYESGYYARPNVAGPANAQSATGGDYR